ncbi:uncharacterized protein YbjT (DUF2867 family) [Herbihabitans rhizosphaerae]|uniref:Uncharacterized protein YbjT (DUF2867 family) n=1 Tax=Herbihabitans rhizosphaerae TaxID=1872711 RepID=A0A4Q7KEK9_9PSEU|nr:NAD(P)H-binding protein [Herbihabitans rhizosphaerae]RZS32521.1 uncharacterized protein YbjT (DUF2867 family) [Herbihabitans rhizosphaerae]
MILVTGATGTIGRALVPMLIDSGERVRALTRDPSRLTPRPGLDVVDGDFADPTSLAKAVDGTHAVFLLTMPGPDVERHDLAMASAVATTDSVRTLVKLSAIGTGPPEESEFPWHHAGEEAVRASGRTWTVLRPTTFASNSLSWADAIRAGQPVPNMFGGGRQGVIDPRDIAEVAVRALTTDRHHERTYTLTGPELISTADQVAALSEALGREIGTVDVPADVAREQMTATGMDPAMIDTALRGAEIVRTDGNAVLTDDVREILGRPATGYRVWARDHAELFTAAG